MKLIYKKISVFLSLFIIICNISACDSITPTNLNNTHINNETTVENQLISTVSTINTNNSFIPYTEYNELGRVPIMMYHGIENIKSSDTGFVGGNVDKDGYFRTAEAFREDLEFFYNSQ